MASATIYLPPTLWRLRLCETYQSEPELCSAVYGVRLTGPQRRPYLYLEEYILRKKFKEKIIVLSYIS